MFQGSNPAVKTTAKAIATYVPTQFASIDVTSQSGSDICAQMASAIRALQAISPGGGTLDLRGFSRSNSAPYSCSSNPFGGLTNSQWDVFPTDMLMGQMTIQTDVRWTVPTRALLHSGVPSVSPQTGRGFVLQASNNFPSFSVNVTSISNGNPAVVTFTTSSQVPTDMWVEFENNGDVLPSPLTFNEKYHLNNINHGSSGPGTCSVSCTANLWFHSDNTGNCCVINTTTTGSGTHAMKSQEPVLQAGIDVSSQGGLDQFQVGVENVQIQCQEPNGSSPAGAIGLLIENAEESSAFRRINVFNCNDNAGIWMGPAMGSHNILEDWLVGTTFANPVTTNYKCLMVGSNNGIAWPSGPRPKLSTLNGFNCYINDILNTAYTVTIPSLALVTGNLQLDIQNSYYELNRSNTTAGSGTTTVTNLIDIGNMFGPASGSASFGYKNLMVGGVGVTIINGVHIANSTGPTMLEHLSPGGTNLIADNNFGGTSCTVPNNNGAFPGDLYIPYFFERADGGGVSERQSIFKFQEACPDIVDSKQVVTTCTGAPTSSFNVINGRVTHC
jgi:hypothetical protein